MLPRCARRRSVRGLIVALLALGACAPAVHGPGAGTGKARLEAAALVASDGQRLPLHRWLPDGEPDAVILALHGFNDYGNAFDAPGRAFAAAGIATFAYDQRGFGAAPGPGLWHGTGALTADAAAALVALAAAYPERPLYLMGESMGGAVAALVLARNDLPPLAGAILSAPAVWGWSSMNLGYRIGLWLLAHLTPSARFSGEGLDIQASDNIAMLIALGADPLVIKETRVDAIYGLVDLMEAAARSAGRANVPILVLYGRRDEIIPPDPTRTFVQALGLDGRLTVYDNGYHMLLRDLQARVVYEDVMTWVRDPGARPPSGADRSAEAFLADPTGRSTARSIVAPAGALVR
ncbi:MAG: alpha/beta hydrolase [Alphaproteobacteria bacterium]|nr:alpha/beta hydrolase [Alphaproteobacteria bacterium]